MKDLVSPHPIGIWYCHFLFVCLFASSLRTLYLALGTYILVFNAVVYSSGEDVLISPASCFSCSSLSSPFLSMSQGKY